MKVITIGRSPENNDVVVSDEKVSRNHLQMVMDDNGNYSVVDIGSTNGTYVNGQRIFGEARLRSGDEVRIGQTVLPWQNYFVTSSQQPIVNPPMPPQSPKPNPKRTWIYIVIGAALLLLIGGGVAWKIYHDKQNEQIEQEEKDKEREERQLEQEANDARVEAARLSEEAEIAARKAAESQSKEDQAKADAAARKAEEANRLAQQKETEWKNMKVELDAARAAQQEAEAQNVIAQQAKEAAVRKAKEANDKAEQAQKDKEYAQKESQLTKSFYSLISEVRHKDFKKICDELKWTPMKGENEKDFIIHRFDSGDNVQKQKIINAIKKVKGRKADEEEPEADQNVNVTEQPASATNDTIKH